MWLIDQLYIKLGCRVLNPACWLVIQNQIHGGDVKLIDHVTILVPCKDSRVSSLTPISLVNLEKPSTTYFACTTTPKWIHSTMAKQWHPKGRKKHDFKSFAYVANGTKEQQRVLVHTQRGKILFGRAFLHISVHIKGQLISKAKFEVFKWSKKQMKIFLYFCPSL